MVSRVTWIKPENSHVTLRFLGEVELNRIEEIADVLALVRFPQFVVQPHGIGCFPDLRHPRILWLGIGAGAHECESLARTVDARLVACGIAPRVGMYTCHFTLGRFSAWQKRDLAYLSPETAMDWPSFMVEGMVLWESLLTSSGPIYSERREFPLLDQ